MELFTESVKQFYGTDWAAMLLTFVFLYLVGNQQRAGFLFGAAASVCWLIFGVIVGSIASPIANIVFIVLNVRAYCKWQSNADNAQKND